MKKKFHNLFHQTNFILYNFQIKKRCVHKQKKPKAEEVIKKIQQVNTFEELKQSFYNITFAELDPTHAEFLNTILTVY